MDAEIAFVNRIREYIDGIIYVIHPAQFKNCCNDLVNLIGKIKHNASISYKESTIIDYYVFCFSHFAYINCQRLRITMENANMTIDTLEFFAKRGTPLGINSDIPCNHDHIYEIRNYIMSLISMYDVMFPEYVKQAKHQVDDLCTLLVNSIEHHLRIRTIE